MIFQMCNLVGSFLAEKNATIILLLFNGGPVDITEAETKPEVSAILDCFLPAQAAGEAIRRVVTMDGPGTVPAGRSPYTWPAQLSQVRIPSKHMYCYHNGV